MIHEITEAIFDFADTNCESLKLKVGEPWPFLSDKPILRIEYTNNNKFTVYPEGYDYKNEDTYMIIRPISYILKWKLRELKSPDDPIG